MTLLFDNLEQIDNSPIFHEDLHALVGQDLRRIDLVKESNGRKVQFNGLALKLYHPKRQGECLLVYSQDSDKPFTENAYKGDAIVMNEYPDEEGEITVAVIGLKNADSLSRQKLGGKSLRVLTLPDNFDSSTYIVRIAQTHKPKYVFSTHNKAKELEGKLGSAKLVCTVAELSTLLDRGLNGTRYDLDEIMMDSDTIFYEDDWEIPVPLVDESIRENPFPTDAFGSLQNLIKHLADLHQTSESLVAFTILGALSTMGQRVLDVQTCLSGYASPTSLFILVEADSGSGKSAVYKDVFCAIEEVDRLYYESYQDEIKDFNDKLNSKKDEKERQEFLKKHKPPHNNSFLMGVSTLEVFTSKFLKKERYNLSINTTEAGKFFQNYSMKRDGRILTISHLSELWDDGSIKFETKQNQKDGILATNAYDCRLSVFLSGQKAIIEPEIDNPVMMGQGFFARFLFSHKPSKLGKRIFKAHSFEKPNDALSTYWDRCRKLLPKMSFIDEEDKYAQKVITRPDRKIIKLDEEANELLLSYKNEIEERFLEGGEYHDDSTHPFANRLVQIAGRISALFAFYDGREIVNKDYVERAIKIVEYSMNEWLNYQDEIKQAHSNAKKLSDWLVKQCKRKNISELNWGTIHAGCPKPMLKNNDILKKEMEVLQASNHVRIEEVGRAKKVIINPKLLED